MTIQTVDGNYTPPICNPKVIKFLEDPTQFQSKSTLHEFFPLSKSKLKNVRPLGSKLSSGSGLICRSLRDSASRFQSAYDRFFLTFLNDGIRYLDADIKTAPNPVFPLQNSNTDPTKPDSI